MSRIIILGATGSLGRALLKQALHQVTALVRDPDRLPPALREQVSIVRADLATIAPQALADIVRGQEALINCAGHVADGQDFTKLVDRLVQAVELLPADEQPRCWFLAGAALMDIDMTGARGVDLPKVKSTYWPHAVNFERLSRSNLRWSLLCPGPMVDRPSVGLANLRVSVDRLPVEFPGLSRWLPRPLLLPLFASKIPEMIIPYCDAAAVILNHLSSHDETLRKRVGIALPLGMKGRKDNWSAAEKRHAPTVRQ